jgi:hypothetical protein
MISRVRRAKGLFLSVVTVAALLGLSACSEPETVGNAT